LTARPRSKLPDLAHPATSSEEATLAAYDKGYAAGWEDAVQASNQSRDKLDTAMANNLEDLGFTYHEARSHVMRSLTPLLSAILTKMLPRLIRDSIGARILEELGLIAEGAADAPVELLVSPRDAEQLRPVAARMTTLPLTVVPEVSVHQGQIFLRVGSIEREIDLDGAMAAIERALFALDEINKEMN